MRAAYIFARGGSVGLPGKNLRLCAGKTLLQHAIDCAHQSDMDAVYVSTDSDEIAREAKKHWADVITRPPELSTGASAAISWKAWQHAIQNSDRCDTFVCLPCVTPTRTMDDVLRTIEALDYADVALTVTQTNESSLQLDAFGFVIGGISDRRQDSGRKYRYAGSVYVARPEFIMARKHLFAGMVKGVIVPRENAIDIDDAFDLRIADLLLIDKQLQVARSQALA